MQFFSISFILLEDDDESLNIHTDIVSNLEEALKYLQTYKNFKKNTRHNVVVLLALLLFLF